MQTAPKFISFEGTEGVGKSTQIHALAQKLTQANIPHIQTREPGGSPFAEKLRNLLIDPTNQITDEAELLTLFAARSDHLHSVILPALAQGKWVICDRFIDSTWAYQGYGRFTGDPKILSKIDLLTQNFVAKLPDLTFWLNLPIETGLKRAKNRSQADRIEQEDIDFFARVHQGFAQMHQIAPKRIIKIDATGNPDAVFERIWYHIQPQI